MQDKSFKYFRFPLFLLRDLFDNKEQAFNNIIRFGIYDFSTKIDYDPENVLKQLVYELYRGKLTSSLKHTIVKLINEEKFYSTEGDGNFHYDTFNCEFEISQLLPIYESDLIFQIEAIEFYQILNAYKLLNIKGDFENCLKVGKKLTNQIPDREPMPMVETSLIFKFRDNKTTDFDLMQLAGFIAINSILGKKDFAKTNFDMIFARAFGFSTPSDVDEETLKNGSFTNHNELFIKYTKRHHREKLLNQLELSWNILKYSHQAMRGFYVGKANKTNYQTIAEYDIKTRKSYKIEQLKQLKKVAYINAKNK